MEIQTRSFRQCPSIARKSLETWEKTKETLKNGCQALDGEKIPRRSYIKWKVVESWVQKTHTAVALELELLRKQESFWWCLVTGDHKTTERINKTRLLAYTAGRQSDSWFVIPRPELLKEFLLAYEQVALRFYQGEIASSYGNYAHFIFKRVVSIRN